MENTKGADFITEANAGESELNLRIGRYNYPMYKIDDLSIERIAIMKQVKPDEPRQQLQTFITDSINEKLSRDKAVSEVSEEMIEKAATKMASSSYCKPQTRIVRIGWFKLGAKWMRSQLKG